MSITFQEIKTPSQMRDKDFIRLASKILFVKTMHNFWPWCGNCNTLKHIFKWNGDCKYERARIGYTIEIEKNSNKPIIRWRKGHTGICKYYEKIKEK